MDIRNLALKLIEQSEVEVYSMLNILRDLSTDEARSKIRTQERLYARKSAYIKSRNTYRVIQQRYKQRIKK